MIEYIQGIIVPYAEVVRQMLGKMTKQHWPFLTTLEVS